MEKRDLYYCPIFEYDKNAKKNVVSAVFGAERTAKGIVQYLYDVEEGEDIFREEKNMPWPLSMKEFVDSYYAPVCRLSQYYKHKYKKEKTLIRKKDEE